MSGGMIGQSLLILKIFLINVLKIATQSIAKSFLLNPLRSK